MQSFRSEPIKPESVTVRRVMSGGLEWREIAHEIEAPGGVAVRQTMWFTAVGPRAYGLALSAQDGEMEAYEPIFKRIVSSVHVGAAGHWNEEYETLRAAFIVGPDSTPESEIEAGRVAEALRTGRESFATAAGRMAELFAASTDAAIDLITDADPASAGGGRRRARQIRPSANRRSSDLGIVRQRRFRKLGGGAGSGRAGGAQPGQEQAGDPGRKSGGGRPPRRRDGRIGFARTDRRIAPKRRRQTASGGFAACARHGKFRPAAPLLEASRFNRPRRAARPRSRFAAPSPARRRE